MTMNHNPIKEKHVEKRLKLWLLSGKTVTHNQAQKMWKTNRIAEFVRRLRNKGMNIITTMVTHDGDRFGVYSIPKEKKVSKIKSREYLNVGVG
jgi:hypothetical protein